MIETTVQRFVKRKKIQPLLIESRYAILGYEIRYYLFIAWKWYKVKILWHTDNRLSAWNSIGLLVSPLTSASPRNAAHRYVTDILVREENSRGGLRLSTHGSIHAFRRGWTQNKDLDWPRSLSPVWNNNAVLSSIRITRGSSMDPTRMESRKIER